MNRLGFLILSVLLQNEAVDKISAMSIREIVGVEDFGYKENTIFKKIVEFKSIGYLSDGFKEGKSNTFYITDLGKQTLKLSGK